MTKPRKLVHRSLFFSEASSQEMQIGVPLNEARDLQVRKLEIPDKCKRFVELLQQLTVCDAISDEDFQKWFQELSSLGDDHVICVIEDTNRGKIVATGSVFIEKKFIRNCNKAGHIEDAAVDCDSRGMRLGKKVLFFLTDHAQSVGCYTVIFDYSNENKAFYDKQKEIQMVKYFI
ncbi:glucosamine 6-phosphate N-acetyltransferase-like [Rhodamnia argentea]|uniref:Glucosamine 6-phosphate N-acetyltransferase n=1 Tax=Rhodamnia argentea TaxID=178133 RepID=A0ABM3H475_9MYRT|nr:glucosamine 6-phosphate N-acetyltransferase-like [Rhodamnia argentea]